MYNIYIYIYRYVYTYIFLHSKIVHSKLEFVYISRDSMLGFNVAPMRSKSMDWFLYDNGLRHERIKDNHCALQTGQI